jgi:resuscitation-promoting factor RpfA
VRTTHGWPGTISPNPTAHLAGGGRRTTMSQHTSSTRARTLLRGGAVTLGAAAMGIGVLAAPAAAAPQHDWSGVAQCESGGNWQINTGNGYYGGLQFSLSTWRGYGGDGMPHRASRAEQIRIAERVQNGQGWGAWPSCSSQIGLR